jgi:hypothetical protein
LLLLLLNAVVTIKKLAMAVPRNSHAFISVNHNSYTDERELVLMAVISACCLVVLLLNNNNNNNKKGERIIAR